jgi:hypothetical protein
VLRLATKYDVPSYRKQIIDQISLIFPTSLKQLDKRNDFTPMPYFDGRGVAVAVLARELDLPTILPSALLVACNWKITFIFDGVHSHQGQYYRLSPADQRLCVLAREKLRFAFRTRNLRFVKARKVSEQCTSRKQCQAACAATYVKTMEPKSWDWDFPPVFGNWKLKFKTCGLCEFCAGAFEESYEESRAQMWDELPSYFDLPPWSEYEPIDE